MKPPVPDWVDHAVFYQIYPQAFYDSNGDGIGDLPGVIVKLDYVKSLGVDAIWFSPFYQSPMRDAGYDVSDFYQVDPRYGTNEDARLLFEEARKRGIRVLVDLVVAHTSVDHPWFKASCDPKPNRFSNWYVWTQSAWDNGGPEFRAAMVHGYGNRDGNYLSNFFWHQPALNFGFAKPDQSWQLPTTHPDVRALWDEMKNILRFWLEMGANGFRIDMAGSIARNDQGYGEAQRFWQEAQEMMQQICPDVFTVAEWSDPKAALSGKGLHADFLHWHPSYESLFRKESHRHPSSLKEGHSFFDREGRGDITEFLKVWHDHYQETQQKGYISIPVANHDLPRISIDRSDIDLEIIFAFLFTMPGVPFLYYGDEIGMRHLDGLPVKEGCYRPRSGARTPMQWSRGPNAGFSSAATHSLWYPVDLSDDAPSVEDQEGRSGSLLNRVRTLIGLRRTEPALAAYADFEILHAEAYAYPFVFLRKHEDQRVMVVLNPSNQPFEVKLCFAPHGQEAKLLAGRGTEFKAIADECVLLQGGECSYGIYRL